MQKIRYFDSHAHYDDEKFDGLRDEILGEVFSGGVDFILNAASDIASARSGAELAKKYPQIYFAAGVHPHECGAITDENRTLADIEGFFSDEKAVAIGEIGLDFHYDFSARETQIKWFRLQMKLAERLNLPVIVHDREAHGACMEIVAEFPGVRGVFHSFSGSAEMAADLIRRGWYISFSGSVTFKNAAKLLDSVRAVDENRLLVETDCPYLAPHPVRGKLNRSDYLCYTCRAIAEVRGVDEEKIAALSMKNAAELFGIKRMAES